MLQLSGLNAMIATAEKTMNEKLASGAITQEQIDKTRANLDMSFEEHADFQTRKSLASQDGTMSLDAAQFVYQKLGSNPSVFNAQPLPVKVVLTKLYAELIERSARRRGIRLPA